MAPQVDEKSMLRRGRVFGAVLGDEGGLALGISEAI